MRKALFAFGLTLATLLQLLVVLPSGSRYCRKDDCGIYYWGAHEHDGVWHQALVNVSFQNWPPVFPTYAGAPLTGYNFLMDLPLAVLSKIPKIPPEFWYFKVLPLIWLGMMFVSINKFANVYRGTNSYRYWLWFFVLLGNSLSYLLTYWHTGKIWGGSGILSMQSPQMLNNLQFAFTIPLIAFALALMKQGENKSKWLKLAIISAAALGIKFYGGIILGLMSIVHGIIEKKLNGLLIVITALCLSGWIFYNPQHSLQGSPILSWTPMATVHPIIEDSNLFYWPKLATARYSFGAIQNWPKLIAVELITLVIFIVFNYGTRLISIGIIKTKKWQKFDLVLLSGITGGLLLNVLFSQRGEWWNTVQFLYYSFILLSVYAAEAAEKLQRGHKYLWLGLIVLLTIPNAFDTARIFGTFPPLSYISDKEIEALSYLKSQPRGAVLALPTTPQPSGQIQPPLPLYQRYDTAYVAAYTAKQTYLNDIVQMRLTGIDYDDRLKMVNNYDCRVLSEVEYIYSPQTELIDPWRECGVQIENIWQQNGITVARVH